MLSTKAKKVLTAALANKSVSAEIAAAIDSATDKKAAAVAAIPASQNIPQATASGSPDATVADVNAAIAVAESRLDAIEAKINAVLAALKAAGLMAQ